MRLCGYKYSTAEAEIIVAGRSTADAVFQSRKGSATHNADMLSANYKVAGIGFVTVAGSPYTFYWVADFGGVVDPTAHTLGGGTSAATRYEQADPLLTYLGPRTVSSTSAASGGSFCYTASLRGAVIATFNGTSLAWIAKKSPAYGKARVTVDGRAPVTDDLYSPDVLYKQKVWSTGSLATGTHTVNIEWTRTRNASATAANIGLDAFDALGTLK